MKPDLIMDLSSRRKGHWMRIVASLVITALLNQDLVMAQGGFGAGAGVAVPKNLASKSETFTSGNGRTIINIQDAHSSIGAQESIVGILDTLVKDYDLKLVAIEGSEGYIDTSIFRTFPDKKVRNSTMKSMVKAGQMSAGEFFAITSDKEVALYGVEDRSLYKENLAQFGRLYDADMELKPGLAALRKDLKSLEEKIYPDEIKSLIENAALQRDGKLTFADRWAHSKAIADKSGLKIDKYDNMSRLADVLTLEKSVNFPKANKERDRILDKLGREIPKEDLRPLVLKSFEYAKGKISNGDYHSFLTDLAVKNGFDMKEFRALALYTDYITGYEAIDLVGVFGELANFEDDIKEKLYANDDQRSLSEAVRCAELLDALFGMRLSGSGFDRCEEIINACGASRISATIEKLSGKYNVPLNGGYDIEKIYSAVSPAVDFYRTAESRNAAILDNTIKRMSEDGRSVAALITGGYHSKGLAELMREKKTSYIVLLPKFDASKGERPYAAILTNKAKAYEGKIKTGEYYIANAPFLDPDPSVTPEKRLQSYARNIKPMFLDTFPGLLMLPSSREYAEAHAAMYEFKGSWVAAYTAYYNSHREVAGEIHSPQSFGDFVDGVCYSFPSPSSAGPAAPVSRPQLVLSPPSDQPRQLTSRQLEFVHDVVNLVLDQPVTVHGNNMPLRRAILDKLNVVASSIQINDMRRVNDFLGIRDAIMPSLERARIGEIVEIERNIYGIDGNGGEIDAISGRLAGVLSGLVESNLASITSETLYDPAKPYTRNLMALTRGLGALAASDKITMLPDGGLGYVGRPLRPETRQSVGPQGVEITGGRSDTFFTDPAVRAASVDILKWFVKDILEKDVDISPGYPVYQRKLFSLRRSLKEIKDTFTYLGINAADPNDTSGYGALDRDVLREVSGIIKEATSDIAARLSYEQNSMAERMAARYDDAGPFSDISLEDHIRITNDFAKLVVTDRVGIPLTIINRYADELADTEDPGRGYEIRMLLARAVTNMEKSLETIVSADRDRLLQEIEAGNLIGTPEEPGRIPPPDEVLSGDFYMGEQRSAILNRIVADTRVEYDVHYDRKPLSKRVSGLKDVIGMMKGYIVYVDNGARVQNPADNLKSLAKGIKDVLADAEAFDATDEYLGYILRGIAGRYRTKVSHDEAREIADGLLLTMKHLMVPELDRIISAASEPDRIEDMVDAVMRLEAVYERITKFNFRIYYDSAEETGNPGETIILRDAPADEKAVTDLMRKAEDGSLSYAVREPLKLIAPRIYRAPWHKWVDGILLSALIFFSVLELTVSQSMVLSVFGLSLFFLARTAVSLIEGIIYWGRSDLRIGYDSNKPVTYLLFYDSRRSSAYKEAMINAALGVVVFGLFIAILINTDPVSEPAAPQPSMPLPPSPGIPPAPSPGIPQPSSPGWSGDERIVSAIGAMPIAGILSNGDSKKDNIPVWRRILFWAALSVAALIAAPGSAQIGVEEGRYKGEVLAGSPEAGKDISKAGRVRPGRVGPKQPKVPGEDQEAGARTKVNTVRQELEDRVTKLFAGLPTAYATVNYADRLTDKLFSQKGLYVEDEDWNEALKDNARARVTEVNKFLYERQEDIVKDINARSRAGESFARYVQNKINIGGDESLMLGLTLWYMYEIDPQAAGALEDRDVVMFDSGVAEGVNVLIRGPLGVYGKGITVHMPFSSPFVMAATLADLSGQVEHAPRTLWQAIRTSASSALWKYADMMDSLGEERVTAFIGAAINVEPDHGDSSFSFPSGYNAINNVERSHSVFSVILLLLTIAIPVIYMAKKIEDEKRKTEERRERRSRERAEREERGSRPAAPVTTGGYAAELSRRSVIDTLSDEDHHPDDVIIGVKEGPSSGSVVDALRGLENPPRHVIFAENEMELEREMQRRDMAGIAIMLDPDITAEMISADSFSASIRDVVSLRLESRVGPESTRRQLVAIIDRVKRLFPGIQRLSIEDTIDIVKNTEGLTAALMPYAGRARVLASDMRRDIRSSRPASDGVISDISDRIIEGGRRVAIVTTENVADSDPAAFADMDEAGSRGIVNYFLYGDLIKTEAEAMAYVRAGGYRHDLDGIRFIDKSDIAGADGSAGYDLLVKRIRDAGVENVGVRAVEGELKAVEEIRDSFILSVAPIAGPDGSEYYDAANTYSMILRIVHQSGRGAQPDAIAGILRAAGLSYEGGNAFRYRPERPINYENIRLYREVMKLILSAA